MFSMEWSCHPCFYYRKKLQPLSEMKWKYCEPIIQCLQNGLDSRFNTYFNVKSSESKEAIIAALSHPFFKNKWLACVPSEKHEQLISVLKVQRGFSLTIFYIFRCRLSSIVIILDYQFQGSISSVIAMVPIIKQIPKRRCENSIHRAKNKTFRFTIFHVRELP